MDTLRNLALSTDGVEKMHPYLHTVWNYLLLFLLNDVPNEVREEYAMQILMMLHKQNPEIYEHDPNTELQVRPINVGTSP